MLILQVTSYHHFQYDEQLAVTDITIAIDVVDLEREPQFLLLIALGAEGTEAGDEFLEIHVAATVFIEYRDHATMQ